MGFLTHFPHSELSYSIAIEFDAVWAHGSHSAPTCPRGQCEMNLFLRSGCILSLKIWSRYCFSICPFNRLSKDIQSWRVCFFSCCYLCSPSYEVLIALYSVKCCTVANTTAGENWKSLYYFKMEKEASDVGLFACFYYSSCLFYTQVLTTSLWGWLDPVPVSDAYFQGLEVPTSQLQSMWKINW